MDSEHPPIITLRGPYAIPCSYESPDLPQHTPQANVRALEAILSALDTAAVLPPAPDLLSSRSPQSLSVLLSHDLNPTLDTTTADTATAGRSGADLEPNYTAHASRNTGWVRALFGARLPRAWAARLAYALDAAWEGTREGQAMYRLLCATGWLPRAQYASTADVEALAAMGPRDVERWRDERVERVDARNNARRRVYNMRYPRAARGWGPFLPYCEELPYAADELDEGDEEMDSSDGEWYDGEQGDEHGDKEEDERGEEDGLGGVEEGIVKRASAAFRIPSHLLTPDWAFLASVRIVVEANMRENGWEGLNGVSELDAVRIGRWPPEREGQELGDGYMTGEGEKVKVPRRDMGRKPTADSVEGWDWAGVEGLWR